MRKDADPAGPCSRWPRELIAGKTTGAVIGAFFEVYNNLGSGFLEAVYANALEVEFRMRGIRFVREFPLKVFYKGQDVGAYRADFLIERQVIVELKAGRNIAESGKAQLLNYLRGTALEVGLLLKFGQTAEFDRVVNSQGRQSAQIS